MKKTGLLLFVISLFMSVTGNAEVLSGNCGKNGNNLTYTLDTETGVLKIVGNGEMEDYSWEFNAPWYSHSANVLKIELPDGLTSVGMYAFYKCSSLTAVDIPNSVISIGGSAFRDCNSLTSVTIPNSVTSIGKYAFEYCSSLTSITIPNSVMSIGEEAFYGCSSLTSINIPNSVTSIGEWAFGGCYVVYGNLNNECTVDLLTKGLTIVDIEQSDGLLIKDNEVVNCRHNTSSVTIPNSVTSIGRYAFEYCSSLISVSIPNSVTSIGERAFSDCYSLSSITIPNSVTSIGNYAFYNCYSLTSITIPNSVTSIGESAFSGCYVFYGNLNNKCTVDLSTKGLTIVDIEQSDGLLIKDNVVINCRHNASSVTIPNSATSIGNSAFSGCTGLNSVTIPNSVTSIGNSAFSGCSGLTSVNIPNSVTSIEDYAFEGCSSLPVIDNIRYADTYLLEVTDRNLSSYKIKEGTRFIGDKAFLACTGLTSVIIPNSVISIGATAFGDCNGLTSVTIPNSVISIGAAAFGGCTGLTSIIIPNSVTSIGKYAFNGCTGLTSVTISNSVTSIEGGVFCNCSGLISINIPNSVTSIGESAFWCCTNLTTIIIPNSLTSIGVWAFYGCNSKKTMICYATKIPVVSNSTFGGINSTISTLYVPSESVDEYSNTEYWNWWGTIKALEPEMCAIPVISFSEDTIEVYIIDGVVNIENAPMNGLITIYTTDGVMFKAEQVTEKVTTFDLPRNTIYIIKIGEKTFKVKI